MPLPPPPYESFEFYGDLFLVQCWDTWSCSRFLDNWEGGRYSMGTSLVISQLKELAKAVSISFMGRKMKRQLVVMRLLGVYGIHFISTQRKAHL